MRKKIAIVGGGITGLVAAYTLIKKSAQKGLQHTVVLFEGGTALGGKISTEHQNGCLLEMGPDTIHDRGGVARTLISELGLSDDIILPHRSGYSIVHKGRPHAVDSGIMGSLARKAKSVWSTRAVSWHGKARALLGNLYPPPDIGRDISIAEYSRARWGMDFSQVIVEPLLSGIHGGDSERLSMKALYPNFFKNSWRGSGDQAGSMPQNKAPSIFTLERGLSSFVEKLQAQVPADSLSLGARVQSIRLTESGGVSLTLNDRPDFEAAACVLAIPAFESAKLLAASLPREAHILSTISFTSTVVVTVAISSERQEHIPSGNGFMRSCTSTSPISTCTWSSLKWPGRSPDETLLARCFLHSGTGAEYLTYSDDGLTQLVAAELGKVLGAEIRPIFSHVKRYSHAFPQYQVGHIEKVAKLEALEKRHPQLQLAGASFRGASITSCIRDGQRVAARIYSGLSEAAGRTVSQE